jgi:hypothetical protein
MREPLVVAVAQPPCMPYDVAINAASHAAAVGGYAESAGCSGIWTSDGAVLAQAGPDTGEIARATLS